MSWSQTLPCAFIPGHGSGPQGAWSCCQQDSEEGWRLESCIFPYILTWAVQLGWRSGLGPKPASAALADGHGLRGECKQDVKLMLMVSPW